MGGRGYVQAKDLMQRCENIRNDVSQIAANALAQALVDTLYVELQELIDPSWIEFAGLCGQLIYSAEASDTENSVKDTLDAIFVDKAGCQRLLKIRVSMAVFVLQRLLPNASEVPVLNADDEQEQRVALLDIASGGDRAKFMNLWMSLLEAKTLEGVKDVIKQRRAATVVEQIGVKAEVGEGPSASSGSSGLLGEPCRFISDTCTVKIPGTSGTPAAFRILLAALEYKQLKTCSLGSDDASDFGYSSLYEKGGSLYAKNVSKNLRLHFFGRLSLVPTDGAIHVGTVWKAALYAHSKETPSSPWFIPAWAVKRTRSVAVAAARAKIGLKSGPAGAVAVASADDPAHLDSVSEEAEEAEAEAVQPAQKKRKASAKEKPKEKGKSKEKSKEKEKDCEPSMVLKVRTIQMCIKDLKTSCQGMFGVMAAPIPDSIALDIPFLVPAPWAIGKKDLALSRGSLTGQLSKDSVKQLQLAMDRKKVSIDKAQAKVEANKVMAAVESTAKGPKHLRL